MSNGVLGTAFILSALLPSAAKAEESTLQVVDTGKKKLNIDGWLKDWGGTLVSLNSKSGAPKGTAEGAVSFDSAQIYIAIAVSGTELSKGAHGEFEIAVPSENGGYQSAKFQIMPGVPGKSSGALKSGGRTISGAKVVEAYEEGGLVLEASIPWSQIPAAGQTRLGLRAALRMNIDSSKSF